MITKSLTQEVSQLEADLCSALADSTRILILYALAEKSQNVTEITRELNIAQPTVSRHLKILREHGLVHAQRSGTTIIYHLSDKRIIEAMDILRSVLRDRLAHRASLMEEIE